MNNMHLLWLLLHLFGLSCGLGAATVKTALLLTCTSDVGFTSIYLRVNRTITRIIITGMILLTLSGIGWLVLPGGYSFTPLLVTKIALVLALWIVGPLIDHVFEPAFSRLAPRAGDPPAPEFIRARSRLTVVECVATGLFCVATYLGVRITP